jgi:hypothetical protein
MYGLHGWPQMPVGVVASRPGPLLAATDQLIVRVAWSPDSRRVVYAVQNRTQTWLDLNAAYDAAVRRLYQALVDSKGKVNAEVRKAFDGEVAARKRLPPDTKGLVIILAEIGRGGLNQAVISIEQARAELWGILSRHEFSIPLRDLSRHHEWAMVQPRVRDFPLGMPEKHARWKARLTDF